MSVQWTPLGTETPGKREETTAKTKAWPRLWVSAGLGVTATVCQCSLMSAVRFPGQGRASILVATRPLARGERVDEGAVESRPTGDLELAAGLLSGNDWAGIRGRKLLLPLEAGQPLLGQFFPSRLGHLSDPQKIPPGMRLFVLKADLEEMEQVLSPGDLVDILAHLTLPGMGPVVETLGEAVEVVGVGDNVFGTSQRLGKGGALSFYANPEQVKLLTYASKVATFSVTLRNPGDQAKSKEGSFMTLNKFLASPGLQSILTEDVFQIKAGPGDGS